jgi:phosphate transport system substrate-binding protein
LKSVAFGIVLAALAAAPAGAQEVLGDTSTVRGAGSTFAHPILSRWAQSYQRWIAGGGEYPAPNTGLEDPPTRPALAYEPSGSLAGMMRVKAAAVDFGASDVPLRPAELAKLGLGQFPIVIGGVVAVVNVDGIAPGALKLTGPVLADIFLGKIVTWSDPPIAALNPGLKLPDAKISVIRRSDGSGTTFHFTTFLAKASPEWKDKIGADLLVKWPVGTGAKGNEGVARAVKETRNSIGYVEFAQALRAKLSFAQLQNGAGVFVTPSPRAFEAAAASADWKNATDFHMTLAAAPGEGAYPIVASVFVMMRKSGAPRQRRAALDFFRWALDHGSKDAAALGYVPLPQPLVEQVKTYLAATFR